MGFEGLCHGGLRGETAPFGYVGQETVGFLMDKANSVAYTVL